MKKLTTPARRASLRLVHAVGMDADLFDRGSIVLHSWNRTGKRKRTLLYARDERGHRNKLRILIAGVGRYWEEEWRVDGEVPRTWETKEAAEEAGMQCEWGAGKERPTAGPVLGLSVLVANPRGKRTPVFCVRLGRYWYAEASLKIHKLAYKAAEAALANCERAGLSTADLWWALRSKEVRREYMPARYAECLYLMPGRRLPAKDQQKLKNNFNNGG